MNIESLDDERFKILYEKHLDLTQLALTEVLGRSEEEASALVEDVRSKFRHAPRQERNWLLHNDPIALACDLANMEWSALNEAELKSFNTKHMSHELL